MYREAFKQPAFRVGTPKIRLGKIHPGGGQHRKNKQSRHSARAEKTSGRQVQDNTEKPSVHHSPSAEKTSAGKNKRLYYL